MPAGSGHSYTRYYCPALLMTLIHNGWAPAKVQMNDRSGPKRRRLSAASAVRFWLLLPRFFLPLEGVMAANW
jgi:hypothetical protein